MSKFALPLAAAVVLVVGCQQSVEAQQGQTAKGDVPSDFQREDAPEGTGTEDPIMAGKAEAATCVVGDAAPQPCTMSFGIPDDAASRVVSFKIGNDNVVFRGNNQGPWWSGALDGNPAMGYELNRGHVVFSNQKLDQQFEYWTKGNEHGSY